MESLSLNEIRDMIGGKLVRGNGASRVMNISIDSRKIKSGELFWAIPGEKYDGHDFVLDALRKGASGAVISKKYLAGNIKTDPSSSQALIQVSDTLSGLQTLAEAYRKRFAIPLIAVTGSNGKTTTKEIISQILSAKFKVLKNEGNFNNPIGLPLSLLGLSTQHQVAVLEMGMNHAGEIARLCEIARPNIGLITNIGAVHLEFLGSIENVQEAKAELVKSLKADDLLILNFDDPRVNNLRQRFTGKVLFYGLSPRAHIWADQIELKGKEGSCFVLHDSDGKGIDINLKIMGHYNIYNALAGAAIGYAFQIPMVKIKRSLESFRGIKMRLQPHIIPGDILLIDDSYNANPQSLQYAIDTLVRCCQGQGRAFLVMGDMLELGKDSERLHRMIGHKIAQASIDCLITLGPSSSITAEESIQAGMDGKMVFICEDHEEVIQLLLDQLKKGDRVLIKGSRGMAMDKIVDRLSQPRKVK
jgi:UDP-N-acetylmuramoyl-tripeptide--D-alanyl-D-alanine ligase